MDRRMGDNVNGPSLIRVPDWVARPLGRYYLYFGHHDGRYIRLAYADRLLGPWTMHEPGVLPLGRSGFAGHVASPDVHVDRERREIWMYYHGSHTPSGPGGIQWTRVARSTDGLAFTASLEHLGAPYFRVFRWNGWAYAMGMPGIMYRSRTGLAPFEQGPALLGPETRHVALDPVGDLLRVYYTRVGDAPERILLSTISLTDDWHTWRASTPVDVLRPERPYEGGDEPVAASKRGLVDRPVRQLRDPAIFREDGKTYLLYSVAGERGIAVAAVEQGDE
jgi:hypothetical protein